MEIRRSAVAAGPGRRRRHASRRVAGQRPADAPERRAGHGAEWRRRGERAVMFNATNTRNFGIPEGRVNNPGFLNQWGTDGGNRRI